MDFIEWLPLLGGYNCVMMVVDRFNKYVHFFGMKHPFATLQVAHISIKDFVRLYGISTSIITNRGQVFLSPNNFLEENKCILFIVRWHTEVVNRGLEAYLRCFASDQLRQLTSWMPWDKYWFNTHLNVSTNFSPFKIVYGRDPLGLIDMHN